MSAETWEELGEKREGVEMMRAYTVLISQKNIDKHFFLKPFRKIEVKRNLFNSIERTYTKSDGVLLKYGNQHCLLLGKKQIYDVSSHHFWFSVPSSPCQKRRKK